MQDNTVTLAVDMANTGTTTDETYRRFDEQNNRTTYVGPAHSLVLRDQMTLYRTLPKANGNFKGMAKSAIKFTQDISIPGVDAETTITVPHIVEVSFSLPVGTSAEVAMIGRQKLIALLDDDTVMVKLEEGLEI